MSNAKLPPAPKYPHAMLGTTPDKALSQWGIYAKAIDRNRTVGFNLNDPQCISLFGQPGAGKSYSLGVLIEMAVQRVAQANRLPSPLCAIVFHYADSEFYPPEFVTMVDANANDKEAALLKQWGIAPHRVDDVLVLTPKAMLAKRRQEFPKLQVEQASFQSSDLTGTNWKILMGAVGLNDDYLQGLKVVLREVALADDVRMTCATIRAAIEATPILDQAEKRRALMRLRVAETFIDDEVASVGDFIKPGRVIIVDARDEFIEKDEIFAVLMVMLQVFSGSMYEGEAVNKIVVFDECHQYLVNDDLIDSMISMVRVMRHKRTHICFSSQDPISVHKRIIELSTQLIMHKMVSREWLGHIASVNEAVSRLKPSDLSDLNSGQAWIWSQKASDEAFTRHCTKCVVRPRFSHHGGNTKSATGD